MGFLHEEANASFSRARNLLIRPTKAKPPPLWDLAGM
jgi:hypothetical protein